MLLLFLFSLQLRHNIELPSVVLSSIEGAGITKSVPALHLLMAQATAITPSAALSKYSIHYVIFQRTYNIKAQQRSSGASCNSEARNLIIMINKLFQIKTDTQRFGFHCMSVLFRELRLAYSYSKMLLLLFLLAIKDDFCCLIQ